MTVSLLFLFTNLTTNPGQISCTKYNNYHGMTVVSATTTISKLLHIHILYTRCTFVYQIQVPPGIVMIWLTSHFKRLKKKKKHSTSKFWFLEQIIINFVTALLLLLLLEYFHMSAFKYSFQLYVVMISLLFYKRRKLLLQFFV